MTIQEQFDSMGLTRAEKISRLNDQLRKTGKGGTVVITRNASSLPGLNAAEMAAALADYDDFNENNNPHGERDMGRFVLFDTDLYFKIDYYDLDLKFGSEDPTDISITHRVLTVMTEADF